MTSKNVNSKGKKARHTNAVSPPVLPSSGGWGRRHTSSVPSPAHAVGSQGGCAPYISTEASTQPRACAGSSRPSSLRIKHKGSWGKISRHHSRLPRPVLRQQGQRLHCLSVSAESERPLLPPSAGNGASTALLCGDSGGQRATRVGSVLKKKKILFISHQIIISFF